MYYKYLRKYHPVMQNPLLMAFPLRTKADVPKYLNTYTHGIFCMRMCVLINRDNIYARFMWWTAVSTFCVFEAAAAYTYTYSLAALRREMCA